MNGVSRVQHNCDRNQKDRYGRIHFYGDAEKYPTQYCYENQLDSGGYCFQNGIQMFQEKTRNDTCQRAVQNN